MTPTRPFPAQSPRTNMTTDIPLIHHKPILRIRHPRLLPKRIRKARLFGRLGKGKIDVPVLVQHLHGRGGDPVEDRGGDPDREVDEGGVGACFWMSAGVGERGRG